MSRRPPTILLENANVVTYDTANTIATWPVSSRSSRAAAARGISARTVFPPGGTQPRHRCSTRRTRVSVGSRTQTSTAIGVRELSTRPENHAVAPSYSATAASASTRAAAAKAG